MSQQANSDQGVKRVRSIHYDVAMYFTFGLLGTLAGVAIVATDPGTAEVVVGSIVASIGSLLLFIAAVAQGVRMGMHAYSRDRGA